MWLGYRIADVIMGPLRTLNMKLQEIQADNMKHDLNDDKKSSMEISLLYKSFQELIRTKKFENNDFLQKDDALAVIDLAEACNMFMEQEPPNLQSAGICFNNIGNIQFKNGSFDMAYDNFKEAVRCAKECKAVTLNLTQRNIKQNVDNWPELNKKL